MKALIFDLDGVVADTSAAHYRSWVRLSHEEGIAFDAVANRRLLGRTREDSVRLFAGERVLDAATTAEWGARKQACFLEELARMGPADALPGVVALLAEARAAGIPLALASSSRNARAVLAQLGLSDAFDVIADGTTVANPKPAPDIFIWCAERLGVAPADCIVFEDAEAGVAAARAGGFQVIGVGRAVAVARCIDDFSGLGLADLGLTEPRCLNRSS